MKAKNDLILKSSMKTHTRSESKVQEDAAKRMRPMQEKQSPPKKVSKKQIMLETLKRVSTVKVLEEAFRSRRIKQEVQYLRQAVLVGRGICLLFFAVRQESVSQAEADKVDLAFWRWDNIEHFLMSDPFKVVSELQHIVKHQVGKLDLASNRYA